MSVGVVWIGVVWIGVVCLVVFGLVAELLVEAPEPVILSGAVYRFGDEVDLRFGPAVAAIRELGAEASALGQPAGEPVTGSVDGLLGRLFRLRDVVGVSDQVAPRAGTDRYLEHVLPVRERTP